MPDYFPISASAAAAAGDVLKPARRLPVKTLVRDRVKESRKEDGDTPITTELSPAETASALTGSLISLNADPKRQSVTVRDAIDAYLKAGE